MGALTLPASGSVYADANTIIYSIETHAAYWPLLQPLWQAAQAGSMTIVSSELVVLEARIAPLRANDALLLAAYDQLFQSSQLRLLPITQAILREAARLRAAIPGLRSPDALHAATALLAGCAMFLTNDRGFRSVSSLPLVVLDEVLAS